MDFHGYVDFGQGVKVQINNPNIECCFTLITISQSPVCFPTGITRPPESQFKFVSSPVWDEHNLIVTTE